MFDTSKSSPIHSAQFLGMVNAMRTGDPLTDMMMAMLAPVVLSFFVQKLLPKILAWLTAWTKKCQTKASFHRRITCRFSITNGARVNMDEDSMNVYLIKAIKLYVHNHCDLRLDDADIELTAVDESSKSTPQARSRRGQNGISTAGMLKSCELVERPIQRKWHDIGKFAGHSVHIYVNDSLDSGKSKNDTEENHGGPRGGGGNSSNMQILEIKLQCHDGGSEPINTFIKTAYEWYNQELDRLEQSDRFLFDLRNTGSPRTNGGNPTFTRYKLGDEKTFESLFSTQCKALLKMVDQFQSKSGKYAIKGYPYKFGVLLSGPPGTGKTSLIKALAHYTNRHIVNVPLSRVSYNSELSDIFFNQSYTVPGLPQTIKLDFPQVIFVLEDVDASSDVVKRRDLQKEKVKPEIKQEAVDPQAAQSPLQNALGAVARPRVGFVPQDELNLTGLLNVLDGCVETPGRMVIMSTNHPEMLDPALIRPGRIDRIMELSYMIPADVTDMLEHYYKVELTEAQKERVANAILKSGAQVTPAEIEQFVMEEDNVDAFVGSLERRGDDSCTSSTQHCDDLSGRTSRDEEETEMNLNVSGTDKARKERVRADELKEQEREKALNRLLQFGLEDGGDY